MTLPAPTGCPTAHRHRFELGGRVTGIALRCPGCAPRGPAQELAEARVTRHLTLAVVAALPQVTRDRLAADGLLARLHRQLGSAPGRPPGSGSAAELAQ